MSAVPMGHLRFAPSLRDSGKMFVFVYPTLKRGANKPCAYGAGRMTAFEMKHPYMGTLRGRQA